MKFLDKIRAGMYHATYHRNLKKAEEARRTHNVDKFKKCVYRAEDAWRKLAIINHKYKETNG
jgi:hypothetical protein